jgi:hypothetical protein
MVSFALTASLQYLLVSSGFAVLLVESTSFDKRPIRDGNRGSRRPTNVPHPEAEA